MLVLLAIDHANSYFNLTRVSVPVASAKHRNYVPGCFLFAFRRPKASRPSCTCRDCGENGYQSKLLTDQSELEINCSRWLGKSSPKPKFPCISHTRRTISMSNNYLFTIDLASVSCVNFAFGLKLRIGRAYTRHFHIC